MPRNLLKSPARGLFPANAFSWAAGLLLGVLALPDPGHAASKLKRVLVLDKHPFGDAGMKESRREFRAALAQISAEHGFAFDVIGQNAPNAEVRAAFSDSALAGYQVVVFDYNEGVDRFVDSTLRPGFESWIRHGGVLLAIHSASSFIADWPFLTESLVECFYGPWGSNKPTADLAHDPEGLADGTETRGIFKGLAAPAGFLDMFISFKHSPRGRPGVTILATVDEKSFSKPISGPMGDDHPVVWTKDVGEGKVIHNSLGFSWSTSNAYTQKDGYLTQLLYNLLRYGAGDFTGCADPSYAEYNPDATHSDPSACLTPASIAARGKPPIAPTVAYDPASRAIRVGFASAAGHTISIFDAGGRQVASHSGSGARSYAFAAPMGNGIYFVKTTAGGVGRVEGIPVF